MSANLATHNYIGFNNQLCTCGYVIGNIDGIPVLVVVQFKESTTSITNMIETIVSQLLASALLGVNAHQLRVFEFYSPSMNPLIVWQEVKFGEVALRKPRKTIVESISEWFKPTEQPFVAWIPDWYGVPTRLAERLSALNPALV